MNKKKMIILVTAVGLLGTSAVAGASGMVQKVRGFIHKDISVTVDGADTAMEPVYINGKAYLPARDAAAALGYTLNWDRKDREIELEKIVDEEEEADYLMIGGVIVNVEKIDDRTRIEVLGHGENNRIILYVDKETKLTTTDGGAFAAKDLKAGLQVTAEYGPIVALSYPGQSHAASVVVGQQTLIKEEPVYAVEKTDDGWRLQFGELRDGVEAPSLTLNAGKETMVVGEYGQPVDWYQIKPGTKVRAYYGPWLAKSLPPQSPAHVIVVLGQTLDQSAVDEYRELAWKLLPRSEKSHLTTGKAEAQVSLVNAKGAAIMPVNDKQKAILADLQKQDAKVVAVLYNTDQDALLGPLTVVLHPETKTLIGYFMRM